MAVLALTRRFEQSNGTASSLETLLNTNNNIAAISLALTALTVISGCIAAYGVLLQRRSYRGRCKRTGEVFAEGSATTLIGTHPLSRVL